MESEKKILPGDMLTGQEQRLAGGTVFETDVFWHAPEGVVKGEYSIEEAASARAEGGGIRSTIIRRSDDETRTFIRVNVPLAPLDPITGKTISDPEVSGVYEVWSELGEPTVVDLTEVLTEEMYTIRGGDLAMHRRLKE